MKIVFITHYDRMYGANKALYKLVTILKEKYGEDPIVVIPAEGEMSRMLEKDGVSVIIQSITQWQAVYSTPLRFMVKKRLRKKKLEQEVDELYEKLKDEKVDLICSNSSVIGTGAMLAERMGCRHIWHIREFSWNHFHMKYFYSGKRVRELYERADCLITISDALKEYYQKLYPAARIRRIYDGVSGNYQDKKEKQPGTALRFCYTAYLFPMKHQEEVLAACEKLDREGYTGYEMYLVGDGKKEYYEKLCGKIKKAGLSRVKMTGYVSNVHELLDTMDVGIIASEYEGFGLATVEYMLHHMPVIGRNSGGTAEIIKDRETGWLYDRTEELAEAMKRFMDQPELISQMGHAGAERAREYFSEEKNAEEMISVYHTFSRRSGKPDV